MQKWQSSVDHFARMKNILGTIQNSASVTDPNNQMQLRIVIGMCMMIITNERDCTIDEACDFINSYGKSKCLKWMSVYSDTKNPVDIIDNLWDNEINWYENVERVASKIVNDRTLNSIFDHLMSEVEELEEEIQLKQTGGVQGADGITGEAVDVILTAYDYILVAEGKVNV